MPDDPLHGFATETLHFAELLGKGAMGSVYRGTQRAMGRTVAIKIIAPHLTGDPAHLERFSREAQTLGRVQHPNVITCHDIGPCTGPDGRAMFVMVLEYVDGWSLGSLLQSRRLTVREVLDLHRQAAEGLAAAHRLGITHRDIKPENIMVTRDGVAKLADFGLAKADDAALLTRSGALLGSPAYMSPEACQGQGVGAASDIYSLGCSLFHALTGTTPFSSTSVLLALQQHVHAPVPLISSRRADLRALDALLARALSKSPADRFADAAEFASALRAALAGIPAEALVGGGLQPASPTPTVPGGAAPDTLAVQATLRVADARDRARPRATDRARAAPLLVAAGVCVLAVVMWPRQQASARASGGAPERTTAAPATTAAAIAATTTIPAVAPVLPPRPETRHVGAGDQQPAAAPDASGGDPAQAAAGPPRIGPISAASAQLAGQPSADPAPVTAPVAVAGTSATAPQPLRAQAGDSAVSAEGPAAPATPAPPAETRPVPPAAAPRYHAAQLTVLRDPATQLVGMALGEGRPDIPSRVPLGELTMTRSIEVDGRQVVRLIPPRQQHPGHDGLIVLLNPRAFADRDLEAERLVGKVWRQIQKVHLAGHEWTPVQIALGGIDQAVDEVRLAAVTPDPFIVGKAVFASGGVPGYAELAIAPGALQGMDFGAFGSPHEKEGLRALVGAAVTAHADFPAPARARILVPVGAGGGADRLGAQRLVARFAASLADRDPSTAAAPDDRLQVPYAGPAALPAACERAWAATPHVLAILLETGAEPRCAATDLVELARRTRDHGALPLVILDAGSQRGPARAGWQRVVADLRHLMPALPIIDLGEVPAFLARCVPAAAPLAEDAIAAGLTASMAELMGRLRFARSEWRAPTWR